MSSHKVGAYTHASDLWIITSYFNTHGYETKLRNYALFLEKIERSGLNLLVVECAFGNDPFALRRSPNVLQIRGKDIMWQKERLLNIAINQLPDSCEKVAWLDCDILFENADWVVQTSALLDQVPVVQPFDKAVRLPMGRLFYNSQDKFFAGFCSLQNHMKNLTAAGVASGEAELCRVRQTSALQMVYCGLCGDRIASSDLFCASCSASLQPAAAMVNSTHSERPRLGDFEKHGHTGFAWAARKELLLNHGLYDASLSGTGDHLMAHAMCGDWDSPCIQRLVGENERQLQHFLAWGERVYADVAGNVAYVEGTISHLWHGDDQDRNYKNRGWELARFSFDPAADLRLGDNGCWEWNSDKPDLHQWAIDYFGLRREDGNGLGHDRESPPSQQSFAPTASGSSSRQGLSRQGMLTPDNLEFNPETP